jgi:hypothetical protein
MMGWLSEEESSMAATSYEPHALAKTTTAGTTKDHARSFGMYSPGSELLMYVW